jgi:hypothetical protein
MRSAAGNGVAARQSATLRAIAGMRELQRREVALHVHDQDQERDRAGVRVSPQCRAVVGFRAWFTDERIWRVRCSFAEQQKEQTNQGLIERDDMLAESSRQQRE